MSHKYLRYEMKHVLTGLLSSAAVFARPRDASPGQRERQRRQIRSRSSSASSADQTPRWSAYDVAVGEPFPAVTGANAFYGTNGVAPLGTMTAVITPTRPCEILKDTTNGRETVVCGL